MSASFVPDLVLPAELEADSALDDLIRTGVVAIGAERARLETSEDRAHVRRVVAGLTDPAAAWARLVEHAALGQGLTSVERLFHLRRGFYRHGMPRERLASAMAASIRVALCPSPRVPPARCAPHPISIDDVVRFGVVGRLLAGAEALADRAVRALDAIGDGTFALSREPAGPRVRRPVWTPMPPGRVVMACRPALLLAVKLIEDTGDGRWSNRGGPVPVPAGHHSTWSAVTAEAVGARAWSEAVGRGVRVSPTREYPGSRLFVREGAVGSLYAELENPFLPLLHLRVLGISVRGFSGEAVSLNLLPTPATPGDL